MSQQSRGTGRAIRNAKKMKNALREQGVEVKLSQVEKALATLGNFKDFNTLIGVVRNAKGKPPGKPTNIICQEAGPYSKESQSWLNRSQWTVHFIDSTLATPENILHASLYDQTQDEEIHKWLDPTTGEEISKTPFSLSVTLTLELAEYILTKEQENTLFRHYDTERIAGIFSGFIVDGYVGYDEFCEDPIPKPFDHYTITIPLSKKPIRADINWIIEQVARYHHRECQRIIAENKDIFTRLLTAPKPGALSLTFPVHSDNSGSHVGWVTLPDAKSSWGIFRRKPEAIIATQSPFVGDDRIQRFSREVPPEKIAQEITLDPKEVDGERCGYPIDLERHKHCWKVVTHKGESRLSGIDPRREGEIGDWYVVDSPNIKDGPNPIKEARNRDPLDSKAMHDYFKKHENKTPKPTRGGLSELSWPGEDECPYCGQHQYNPKMGYCTHCD